MNIYHPYTIFPLGDSAFTIDFGNIIDDGINKKVLQLFNHLKNSSIPFVIDIVPAYSSLAVYYDVVSIHQKKAGNSAFEFMVDAIEGIAEKEFETLIPTTRRIEIPVCYDEKFALDILEIAIQKNILVEEIIHIHTSKIYRVFMIGFLPGFAYMGEVDERIAIPRRREPRINVPPGSVGIAGKQTGIYPFNSPGGWQIIGRTPVKVFDKENNDPVLFQPGDQIKFYSITEDEFAHY